MFTFLFYSSTKYIIQIRHPSPFLDSCHTCWSSIAEAETLENHIFNLFVSVHTVAIIAGASNPTISFFSGKFR